MITRSEAKFIAAAFRISEPLRKAEGKEYFEVSTDAEIDADYDALDQINVPIQYEPLDHQGD